ncbi:phosphopantetheine-binding protein [Ekhidna sp.]
MTTTQWLQEIIADESGEKPESVSISRKFETMNLDSLSLLSLAHEIESKLSLEIDPTALTEYDTIEKLAKWIESNS